MALSKLDIVALNEHFSEMHVGDYVKFERTATGWMVTSGAVAGDEFFIAGTGENLHDAIMNEQ